MRTLEEGPHISRRGLFAGILAAGLAGCTKGDLDQSGSSGISTEHQDQPTVSETSVDEFPEDITNIPLDTGKNAENAAKNPRDPIYERNLRQAFVRLQRDGWRIEGPVPGSFEEYLVNRGKIEDDTYEEAHAKVFGANPFDQEAFSVLPGEDPVKIIIHPVDDTLPVYDLSALSENYYYVP